MGGGRRLGRVGGGFSIGAKVTSGKREKEEEKNKKRTQPGSPERVSTQLPQTVERQSTNKIERKKEKMRNVYFIVFLKLALGINVACLKSGINMSRALTSAGKTMQVNRENT